MRRRKFTAMIGLSSLVTLAGCNDVKKSLFDSDETPEAGDSTEGTTETSKSDAPRQPVKLSVDDVTNVYTNGNGIPVLNSAFTFNIANPHQTELDIQISLTITGEETTEASVPAESSSTVRYDTTIAEEGEYDVVIDGGIVGNEQYEVEIDEATVPEITFATPSIVQSYTSDGMGQNSQVGFGADQYAAQDAKGLLENEQEVGGFGERLQNVQKIQCEFPDEYEKGTDPQCRIKDICIAGDLIYIYNQWRNEDPLVSSTANQLGFSVCAVDIWSGEEIWEEKFGKNVEIEGGVDRDGPGLLSVDDEHLFYSAQDGIHALDRETGKETWTFNADSTNQIFLIENTLFTSTDSLYAIDAETGEEKWSSDESAVILAGNEGTVITKSSGRIESIEIGDGSLNWSFDSFSEPGLSNVCAHTGSKVFVTADVKFNPEAGPMGLYCLDAQTGEKLWRQPISTAYEIPGLAAFANGNNIPLIDEQKGLIYVHGTGKRYGGVGDFGFQCYDIESGELIWRNSMVHRVTGGIASTSIGKGIKAGDYVYGSREIAGVNKDFMNEKQVETRLISNYVINSIDGNPGDNYPQTHGNLRPLFAHGALFYVYDDLFKDYIRVFTGCSANSGATGECTTDTSTSEPKETATEAD